MAVTLASITRRYRRCEQNVFETVFADHDPLGVAFMAWGEATWPDFAEQAGGDPMHLEAILRDEQSHEAVAAFFLTLAPALQREAIAGLTATAPKAKAPKSKAART